MNDLNTTQRIKMCLTLKLIQKGKMHFMRPYMHLYAFGAHSLLEKLNSLT